LLGDLNAWARATACKYSWGQLLSGLAVHFDSTLTSPKRKMIALERVALCNRFCHGQFVVEETLGLENVWVFESLGVRVDCPDITDDCIEFEQCNMQ
jgi:hypothetical protein